MRKNFLGIKVENSLNFKEHIECLSKKANQKIHVLSTFVLSMNFKQRTLTIL